MMRWCMVFAALLAPPAFAQSVEIPPPPSIGARAYLLIDHVTGKVLAEADAWSSRP